MAEKPLDIKLAELRKIAEEKGLDEVEFLLDDIDNLLFGEREEHRREIKLATMAAEDQVQTSRHRRAEAASFHQRIRAESEQNKKLVLAQIEKNELLIKEIDALRLQLRIERRNGLASSFGGYE